MLDALKNLAGGGKAQKQAEDLEALIAKAREERMALNAMLARIAVHASTLTETSNTIEDVQKQIRQSHEELHDVHQSIEQATVLRGELGQLREIATQLTHDHSKAREISREADDNAFAALEAVKDIEKRLGRLGHLQELGRTADDKLAALDALAGELTEKARILEDQKPLIDRAVVGADHVSELVAKMDAQIATLNETFREFSRGEEIIARIDISAGEARTQMERVERTRDEFTAETARLEKEGRELVESMRAHVERLALEKRESEVLDQRLRSLSETVRDAETRIEALSVREGQLAHLPRLVEEFGAQFEKLAAQAEDLGGRQASLETLRERLSHVEGMSTRAASMFESLNMSRGDLETLRKEIQDFHHSYTEAAQLRDKLGADRISLERFTDRLASFRVRVPELEASTAAILEKMALLDENTKRADRLSEVAAVLDARLTRLNARTQVVEILEGRLNGLHVVSSEVDAKLAQQLARRVELDTVKLELDGVMTQMIDAQQKLEGVTALQSRVLPMETQLTSLQDRLEKTGTHMAEVLRGAASLAEQEARLTELVEKSQSLSTEAADRMQQVEALTETLARATSFKDELIDELARVRARQREALSSVETTEEQLRRAETLHSSLEQRRTQLVFSEKKLAWVEARMAELTQMTSDMDSRISALAERDAVVTAVTHEVNNLHQVGAKSREDLQYLSAHREDVAALRRQMQDLLGQSNEVEAKISDVTANLETVNQKKTLVDQLTEKLAKVDFIMREAQNTLRVLSQERELAQRTEQNLKQLRSSSHNGPGEGRQLA